MYKCVFKPLFCYYSQYYIILIIINFTKIEASNLRYENQKLRLETNVTKRSYFSKQPDAYLLVLKRIVLIISSDRWVSISTITNLGTIPIGGWEEKQNHSSLLIIQTHFKVTGSIYFKASVNGKKSKIHSLITVLPKQYLEKAMAPHSSTLAWKIPWMEEPGRLQSMGSLRVRHNWATSLSLFTFMHWRRKWQPTPVFLPGESQGRGSLVGCHLWGHTESDTTEAT